MKLMPKAKQSGTVSKFLPLDFLVVSQRILWNYKNAVYHLQIYSLVPEIFKSEKHFKHANEITDDAANLHRRPLKRGL